MPKELLSNQALEIAINRYQKEIGHEAYQPLETLLNKLKNLCNATSITSQELPVS